MHAEVIFVAVGTPPRADGAANLLAVDSVAETVARTTRRESVLVLKSTVPVGTNERVRKSIKSLTDKPIHVVSNPDLAAATDHVRKSIGAGGGVRLTFV